MKIEEWRNVVGYEDLYAVSNCGRVKRTKQSPGTRPGMILSAAKNSDGYLSLGLYKDGVRKSVKVHALVVKAFIGEIAEGMEVNHRDGDKSNNNADNLEITTRSGNVAHAFQVLKRQPVRNFGEDSGHAVLTADKVREIRSLHASGSSQIKIASQFAVSRAQIGRIVNRQRWAHVE